MKIVMVTGEANPLVKTGGLADVVYSLSKELVKSRKNDVSIIMPFYKQVKAKLTKRPIKVCSFEVYMSWRKQYCVVYKTIIEGIRYFLIKNDQYFNSSDYESIIKHYENNNINHSIKIVDCLHGFGLGTNTEAEGWVKDSLDFYNGIK